MLTEVASIIRKLAYGENLTATEARHALNVIGSEDVITDLNSSDGLYFLALTLGVMAKGPIAAELHGFVLSISDQSVRLEANIDRSRLIDLSGTGGDAVKTFNVGTVASVIVSAAGGYVAKQATRGYTGLTGSADIYSEIGVDVRSVTSESVIRSLESTGIAAFYTPAFSEGFKNRIDFLTKLKTIGLTYPTPWHLVSWVYSPFTMDARLYGVYDRRYLRPLAQLFSDLGYKRVMIVHGVDGLDEISNVGETAVAELRDGAIREYKTKPEDYGIERAQISDIETLTNAEASALRDPSTTLAVKSELAEEGKRRNVKFFFEILYGRCTDARRDLALINAGAALYLIGLAANVKDGIAQAAAAIDSGRAKQKLHAFVAASGDLHRLRECERRLGL